jgi:serpin B
MMKNTLLITASLLSTLGFAQNEFTFDFFNEIENQENVLFSPTSIKTAFAMAYEGAAGNTQAEFEEVFNFSEDNTLFLNEIEQLKEVAEISNSVWIQDKFEILASYVKKLKENFDSEPYRTDFENNPKQSAEKINKWIEESTKGMIKNMVTPDAVVDFKLAIVNAIYFKQNWKKTFEKELTKKDDFTNSDETITEVDMMHSSDHYKAYEGRNEKIIELPYNDDKTSMVIILPYKMKNYKMSNKIYNNLTSYMVHQKVILDLPKFTFETPTFELKPFLFKMGLAEAFTDGANFSNIRKERDLKIGTALHKAKIIVNEEGTEAAAATIIGVITTSSVSTRPAPILKIKVNKPFFYFIKDNETNAILFMGRMNKMD